METRFIVVRHGETEWNVQGRVQGHLDSPLTAAGREQAETVARALAAERVHAIYSSDLGRTLDTAAPAARRLGLGVRMEPRLRERQLGLFQGLTFDEASQAHPERFARFRARDTTEDLLTGESLVQMRDRVAGAFAFMASVHPGELVLVVTHGGVLDQVHRLATGMPLEAPRTFGVENASVHRLLWREGRLHLHAWGGQGPAALVDG